MSIVKSVKGFFLTSFDVNIATIYNLNFCCSVWMMSLSPLLLEHEYEEKNQLNWDANLPIWCAQYMRMDEWFPPTSVC
jgi:hypothetical protein